ncbi:MAG: B12-binding domain-containing radical SAM protein [Elusimicrobia bacterium]|nr:B12-binding domain-containing radical SAM protein [Elusimicrobiota bacterium]
MKADILIVNPSDRETTYGELGGSLSGIEPPIWCALRAGYLRSLGFSVGIVDAAAQGWSAEITAGRISEASPLLADIMVMGTNPSASSTPKMRAAGSLLREIKRKAPMVRTMLSGLHPSALPERTLMEEEPDYVSQGAGSRSIPDLLRSLKEGDEEPHRHAGRLWHRAGTGIVCGSYDPTPGELPDAAWDLLPMERYRAHNWHCLDRLDKRSPYAVIFTSMGCPHGCVYCPVHSFYGDRKVRYRETDKILAEISLLVERYGVKNMKVMDELFTLDNERAALICDSIAERHYDLNLWCYAGIDGVSPGLLGKMKKAGFNWVSYGIESGSAPVLERTGKAVKNIAMSDTVRMTRDAGINILANFIFGLPGDSMETMQASLDTAKRYNFEYVNFYVCIAYPGSKLYTEAVKTHARLPEDWAGFGQYSYETLPLSTAHLEPEEVLRFRDEAFMDYFSDRRYLDMVSAKFGAAAAEHIREMLRKSITRKNIRP